MKPLRRSRYEYEKLRRTMKVSGDELAPRGVNLLAGLIVKLLLQEKLASSAKPDTSINCSDEDDKQAEPEDREHVA